MLHLKPFFLELSISNGRKNITFERGKSLLRSIALRAKKEESGSKSCNSTLLGSSVFSSFTKKGNIYWLKIWNRLRLHTE